MTHSLGTVAVLAYTLGLRHAFDADHISAIDNCTRKVLGERQGTGAPRPLGFGFFFSLGHSTVVVAVGAGIVVAEKTVFGAVSDSGSGLERGHRRERPPLEPLASPHPRRTGTAASRSCG